MAFKDWIIMSSMKSTWHDLNYTDKFDYTSLIQNFSIYYSYQTFTFIKLWYDPAD